MTFSPKHAPPVIDQHVIRHPTLERAVCTRLVSFEAHDGYLAADSLAATLHAHARPTLWLRLDAHDQDPARFLISLIDAARLLNADLGETTLTRMRQQPGPIFGWPPLFTQLARELAEQLPRASALVFEDVDALDESGPAFKHLLDFIVPALPDHFTLIFIAQRELSALPSHTLRFGAADLRLDQHAALALTTQTRAPLTASLHARLLKLTEGRAVALAGLCMLSARLGSELVAKAAAHALDMEALFHAVARLWLAASDTETMQQLALTMHMGYMHPALLSAAALPHGVSRLPWLEPLRDDWVRLRSLWRSALRSALRGGGTPLGEALHRAADHCVQTDAPELAVPLYFDLGDTMSAARVIDHAAPQLLDRGQWQTLNQWLGQLPLPTLHRWPWLVCVLGEMASAQGQLKIAQHAFATASQLFTARGDWDGACQSLLAESTLAAWQGEHALALTRASAAHAAAQRSSFPTQQVWTLWQLGRLSAADDKLDDAITTFATASRAASDPLIGGLLQQAESAAVQQRDLRRQREFHRQAYFAAEQAAQESQRHLQALMAMPFTNLDALLGTHGWAHTPLMLKLAAPPMAAAPVDAPQTRPNVWQRLLGMLPLRRADSITHLPLQAERNAVVPRAEPSEAPPIATAIVAADATAAPQIVMAAVDASAMPGEQVLADRQAHVLRAHLLGSFRITLDEHTIESWPSGRGRAIFKYLLMHRGADTPRDVLMETFWPNAHPDAARNSLNVALYGLRRAFRGVAAVDVVLFEGGAYTLNAALQVWLDVDVFEQQVETGQRLEAAQQLAAAASAYEVATGIYQADFLSEDLYEEWPVLTRERLRLAYLDTLDRLSRIYFGQGQYAACATLCQRILERDRCREDAHSRLMRCYSRQNQQPLALRQYQLCVEALRDELQVEPERAITELYERVRRREPV